METAPFQAPSAPGTGAVPGGCEGQESVPILETLGCFGDDVPKTQLPGVCFEILIGAEKLEMAAGDLTGRPPASAAEESSSDD